MQFAIIFCTILAAVAANKLPHFGFPEDGFNKNGRIINGQPAKEGAAPYIVSLKRGAGGSHFCGGSIISPKWVLTAAHCLQSNIFVVAGLHNRNDERNTQIVKVVQQIGHEKFGGGVGPYDIALLRLEKPLVLSDRVQVVSLPADSEPQSGPGNLFGWGKDTTWGGLPNILQTVTTDLLPYSQCKPLLPGNAPIHSTNICSGSKNQGISACNGDSGGPLVQNVGNRVVQVGVVSWGYIPCGQANFPSVYTHTGAYLEWIQNKIA